VLVGECAPFLPRQRAEQRVRRSCALAGSAAEAGQEKDERPLLIRPQRADEAGESEAMRRPSASRSPSIKIDRILFLRVRAR
jgi:hypothetical protein